MPDEEEAQVTLWQVESLRHRQRLPEARRMCESALHRFPRSAHLLDKHGWILLDCHEQNLALQQFRAASDLEPLLESSWRGQVRALRLMRRFNDAVDVAEQARKVLHNWPTILCELAWCYEAMHCVGKAIDVLQEACASSPNYAPAWAWLTLYLAQQHEFERALATGREAVARRPDDLECWEALCQAHLRNSDSESALRAIGHAQRHFRDDTQFELMAAGVLAQCGATYDVCASTARKLQETAVPATVRAASSLYRHHLRFDESRNVITAAQKEDASLKHDADLLCEEAEIAAAGWSLRVTASVGEIREHAHEQLREAERKYEQVLKINPYSVVAIARRAQLLTNRDLHHLAIPLLRGTIARLPGAFTLRLELAEAYLAADCPIDSLRECDQLIEDYPDVTHEPGTALPDSVAIRLQVLRARATRATGEIDEALKIVSDLNERFFTSRRVRLALARSLEDVDENDEGVKLLTPIVGQLPAFPPVAETASLLQRLQNDVDRAEEILDLALGHYGDEDERLARADAGLIAELAIVQFRKERKAEKYFRCLQKRQDVHSVSLGLLIEGWYWATKAEWDKADAAFEKVMEIGEGEHDARFGRAWVALRRSEEPHVTPAERRSFAARARELLRSSTVGPEFERHHILAGFAAHQCGDWEQAERDFQTSVALHHVHGGHVELATVLQQQGKLDAALFHADRAVRLNGEDVRRLALRGLVRLRLIVERNDQPDAQRQDALRDARRDIDRALDLDRESDRRDVTAVSAAVYAAKHLRLYSPAYVLELTQEAEALSSGKRSAAVSAHLALLLAEATLLTRTRWLRSWFGQGAVGWAKRAIELDASPRAVEIAVRGRQRPPMRDLLKRIQIAARLGLGVLGVVLVVLVAGVGLPMASSDEGSSVPFLIALLGAGGVLIAAAMFGPRITSIESPALTLRLEPEPPVSLPDADRSDTVVMPQDIAAVMPQDIAAHTSANLMVRPTFHLLGPAIGPMITGYYAYRDVYFPWRTR